MSNSKITGEAQINLGQYGEKVKIISHKDGLIFTSDLGSKFVKFSELAEKAYAEIYSEYMGMNS